MLVTPHRPGRIEADCVERQRPARGRVGLLALPVIHNGGRAAWEEVREGDLGIAEQDNPMHAAAAPAGSRVEHLVLGGVKAYAENQVQVGSGAWPRIRGKRV